MTSSPHLMRHTYPILSISEAQAFETSVLGGDSARTAAAMENAGRAVGEALLEDFREVREWPDAPRVLVLAGKGLNTGDALVACERLFKSLSGLRVDMVATAPEQEFNPLARAALERLRSILGGQFRSTSVADYLAGPREPVDVALDGIYGLGFRPPLREPVGALLREVNARTDILLRASIDLPSGMGETPDADTFVADFTYIPGVAKAPCFSAASAPFRGRLRFLEIDPFRGQPEEAGHLLHVASPRAHKALDRLRPAQSDKRHYGHTLVLGGSVQMPGAAIMATLGALHAGAGLVTAFTPASISTRIASAVPEAMWQPLALTPEGNLDSENVRLVTHVAEKAGSLLVGPGLVLERFAIAILGRIISQVALPLVLDASALVPDVVGAVMKRPANAGPVVITPHRGEFARLLGLGMDVDSHANLLAFCQKFRLITVLKGSPTLVCDGERIVAVPAGGPVLARGGAGDILAGMLATLLAQHSGSPLQTAVQAAVWHGAAADSLARQAGAIAVRTTDLLPHLAASLRA